MLRTIVLLVSLDNPSLTIEHPQLAVQEAVVVGKPSSPTPTGVFTLQKAYSTQLQSNILIFRRGAGGVYAIHPNLRSRRARLLTPSLSDNRLSAGCIGVAPELFEKLWQRKEAMVLQVY